MSTQFVHDAIGEDAMACEGTAVGAEPPGPLACRGVVVLNDTAHVVGGAAHVAISEACALAALGLDVTFMAAVGPICSELRQANVTTICLDQGELADAGRNPAVAVQSIWNRPARHAVDTLLAARDPASTVVHLHSWTKALSALPAVHAQARGFATVCTLHDFFIACPNGAFFDYREARPCQRTALSWPCVAARCDKRSHLHKLYRVVKGVTQRDAVGFPAGVHDYIGLSEQSVARLRPYLPPDARVHRLRHGTHATRRPPVNAGRNAGLVCAGRLDVEKGVRLLAQTAHAQGMSVRFIGDGPLRSEIESIPGMIVTGWLAHDDVMQMLEAARVLVFPSLWHETYGLVVDEAASRGVPAIISDISAPAERLADKGDGWLFKSGDASSLQAALAETEDDAAVAAAGEAAYARFWHDALTYRQHAVELREIYDRILNVRASESRRY